MGGGFDHQFFNNAKLDELHQKESDWTNFENNPEAFEDKEKPAEFTEED